MRRNKFDRVGNRYNLQDLVFGDWKVVELDPKKGRHTRWLCRCSCGSVSSVLAGDLTNKRSTSCKTCANRRKRPAGDVFKAMYSQLKHNAKVRNIKIDDDLGIQFLRELLIKQDNLCKLSGQQIKVSDTLKGHKYLGETSASIDRVDSNEGYTRGNIQWVHKRVNILKMNSSDAELIDLCQKIVNHNSKSFVPYTFIA